ncbi:MAG: hypothetical protein IID46_16575, partial [Planctomycetes bacterium]|nr:hypothetical protein [Planctomycetota bacterium]
TLDGVSYRVPVDDRDQYFYFAVDNEHLFNEKGITAFVRVTYFDDVGFIEAQYDSISARYVAAKRVLLNGTKTWKTAEWRLTDCRFADGQNGGADFRLFVGPNRVPIKSVELSLVPFSTKK